MSFIGCLSLDIDDSHNEFIYGETRSKPWTTGEEGIPLYVYP